MMYTKENDTFRTFQITCEEETEEIKYNMNDYSHMPIFEISINDNSLVESSISDFDIFIE